MYEVIKIRSVFITFALSELHLRTDSHFDHWKRHQCCNPIRRTFRIRRGLLVSISTVFDRFITAIILVFDGFITAIILGWLLLQYNVHLRFYMQYTVKAVYIEH